MLTQAFPSIWAEVAFSALVIQAVLCLPMIIFERYTAIKLSYAATELAIKQDKSKSLFTKFKSIHDYSTCLFFIYLFIYSIYHATSISFHNLAGDPAETFAFLVIGAIITFSNAFSLFYIGGYVINNFIKDFKKSKNPAEYQKHWVELGISLYEIFIGIILLLLSIFWITSTFHSTTYHLISDTAFNKFSHIMLWIISAFSFSAGLICLSWIYFQIKYWIADYKANKISEWDVVVFIIKTIVLVMIVFDFGIIAFSTSLTLPPI